MNGVSFTATTYHQEVMTLMFRLGLATGLGAFLGYSRRRSSCIKPYALTSLGAAGYVSLFLQLGVSSAELVRQLAETLAWIGPAASAALVWFWMEKKPAACQIVLWTSVAIVAGGFAALGAVEASIILVVASLCVEFIVRRAVTR